MKAVDRMLAQVAEKIRERLLRINGTVASVEVEACVETAREEFAAAFPNGCLHSAEEGEPMFVLLARDRVAPATIRDWAERARRVGSPFPKVDRAMVDACALEKWQRENQSRVKAPD